MGITAHEMCHVTIIMSCIVTITLSDVHVMQDRNSQDNESDEHGDPTRAIGAMTTADRPEWDTNGYTMFCPCMGNFGNQVEYLIGTLAFAKALDRTLVLPPFRVKKNVPFSTWFRVEPLREFHRVITMEDFLEYLSPDRWPDGQRVGYCSQAPTTNETCDMKKGNPLGPFWNELNIDFDDHVRYNLFTYVDVTDESRAGAIRKAWNETFPPTDHPVIVHRFPPAPYPMKAGNRFIQGYIQWNEETLSRAQDEIIRLFHGEKYVGIHLRTGPDWVSSCSMTLGLPNAMASPQCLSPGQMVFLEMCYPPVEYILNHTRSAVLKHSARHVYIATDRLSYFKELSEVMSPIDVEVHHLDPHLPQMDLMILGQADFFIGNCVSSFTSFVKRERDATGKPSTFWGFPV